MDQSEREKSLTGVWHGIYTYFSRNAPPESHFVATIIDTGSYLSGTIHETMNTFAGGSVPANAALTGQHDGGSVSFIKSYDGTGEQRHSVAYAGQLSSDRLEVEGEWRIDSIYGVYRGRFIMIRSRGQTETPAVEVAEHVQ
jgi:hypothetical protein